MRSANAWYPCHGLKMRYVNPNNGKYAMATMATFMQLLPQGFSTAAYRSTDATVFVPIEGRGRSRIGNDVIVEWSKRDIFVVPSWHRVQHEADEDSVLFSFSDRPIQEALYLFREDRDTTGIASAKSASRRGELGLTRLLPIENILRKIGRATDFVFRRTWCGRHQPSNGMHSLHIPDSRQCADTGRAMSFEQQLRYACRRFAGTLCEHTPYNPASVFRFPGRPGAVPNRGAAAHVEQRRLWAPEHPSEMMLRVELTRISLHTRRYQRHHALALRRVDGRTGRTCRRRRTRPKYRYNDGRKA
jgi:hypothetical protein